MPKWVGRRTDEDVVSRSSDFLNDAAHWRFRAEAMRIAAEIISDETNRGTALRLAADYDRLALCAEERASEPESLSRGLLGRW
jgi:hypothetical protein